jgi:hypothetical protein
MTMSTTPATLTPNAGSVVEGTGGKPVGLAGQMQIVAPPVAEEAKVTESAPKEEPDKLAKAKEVAKRGNAARLAWQKSEAEKEQARRENAELRAQQSQLQERIARAERLEAQLRADPLAAMQALGVKAEDAYKRAVMQGKPEGLIAQLREEVATERKERENLVRRLDAQTQAEQIKALESDFTSRCTDAKTYPALSGTPASVLLYAAKQLGAELYQRTKQGYSNQELLSFLNEQFAAQQKARGSVEKDPKSAPDPKEGKRPATSRTISNELATQTWSKPADWGKLPDIEQRRLIAEQVRLRGGIAKPDPHASRPKLYKRT